MNEQVTRSWLARFRARLAELRARPTAEGEELQRQLEISAVAGQIAELEAQLGEPED